jgi:tRNA pseudouridine32 synthase/23S rRNA pseudouridine746 synthase
MIYKPPITSLDLHFSDDYLLVINKPCGLLSVPGRGEDKQDCLITRVQKEYPDALIVHRLDMSTSGLMVIARGKNIERALSILFQKRQVEKTYTAIVNGEVKPSAGEIDLPLITDWPNRPKQKLCFETGKNSQTKYTLIKYDDKTNSSRIKLSPLTGRTHQLRIHMQLINHTILGDKLYGDKDVIAKSPRLLLHADYLSFRHPVSNELLSFVSEADF